MHKLFDALPSKRGMQEAMSFGIEFMHELLNRRGPEATTKFVKGMLSILMTDGVPYEYDITRLHQQKILKDVRKRHSRRDFMKTVVLGWGGYAAISALAATAQGAVDVKNVAKGQNIIKGPGEDDVDAVNNTFVKGILPAGEYLLARKLALETMDDWKDLRFEHIQKISNVVAEIGNKYPELRPVHIPSVNGGGKDSHAL
jgi:ActR/RegA family two-component response regulator